MIVSATSHAPLPISAAPTPTPAPPPAPPPSPSALRDDWLLRSNLAVAAGGWGQLFEDNASVDNWRFSDNIDWDPTPAAGSVGSFVRRNPVEGIMGLGALELEQMLTTNMNSYWCRSFNPALLNYPRAFTPEIASGTRGPGQKFYVQWRQKVDCGGFNGSVGGSDGRKVTSISRMEQSNTHQERVVFMQGYNDYVAMYCGQGIDETTGNLTDFPLIQTNQGGTLNNQPGSTFTEPGGLSGFCSYDQISQGNLTDCFRWHNNQWVTFLLECTPSTNQVANGALSLRAWIDGMTDYVYVINRPNHYFTYDLDKPFGYNAFLCWIYETHRTSGTQVRQWYDQIIFSPGVFIPIPAVNTTPTWRFNLTAARWAQIANTKPQDAQTYTSPNVGVEGKPAITSYSGAQKRPWHVGLGLGGGHQATPINAFQDLDLRQNVPGWQLLKTRTADSFIPPIPAGQPYYNIEADGQRRPTARHNSWDGIYISRRNRTFYLGGWSVWSDPAVPTNKVDAFNHTTNEYDPPGTYQDCPFNHTNNPTGVCIGENEDVWYWSCEDGRLARWIELTATWDTSYGFRSPYGNKTPMTLDPIRRRLIRFCSNTASDGNLGKYLDLTQASVPEVAITWTGSKASAVSGESSCVWCPDLFVQGGFLMFKWDTHELIQIDPTTYAATPYVTTGTIPTLVDSVAFNGNYNTYSRFDYMQELGGCYYIRFTTDDVWFIPTRGNM